MDIKTIIVFISVINISLCVYEEQYSRQQQQPIYREPVAQYKPQQQPIYREPVAQYKPQQQQPLYREPLNKKPPPRILSHKQAQSHDGGFKFAYTAENGLAHSEVISPDGTRNGGYSYVDPHGKTISVKYTAGKDGFRILEGDHVPRDPASQQQAQAPQPAQPHYTRQEEPYRPQVYQNPQPQPYYKPQYSPQKPTYITAPAPPPPRNYAPVQETESSNSVEENKEPDYHDEPGKPYSFGVGYAFQFTS